MFDEGGGGLIHYYYLLSYRLDEWSAYLSNMSELTQQGGHGGGGQIHVQQQ